jgi:hypothetical protein
MEDLFLYAERFVQLDGRIIGHVDLDIDGDRGGAGSWPECAQRNEREKKVGLRNYEDARDICRDIWTAEAEDKKSAVLTITTDSKMVLDSKSSRVWQLLPGGRPGLSRLDRI